LAAQNQAAINLPAGTMQDAGEGCVKQRLMGKGERRAAGAPLPEQVTKQSGNSLLNLRLGGDRGDLSGKRLREK